MVIVRRRLGAFTSGVFIGILSLQGGFPWRLWINLLLHAGWCSWIPFVGLLLVGQSLPVMRLVSVSSESGVCLGCSTVKQHGVLLMGFKNQDSLLNRESAGSFILDLLHCGRWRNRLRQRWSAMAAGTGCSYNGLMCNFIFFQGYPVRGLGCKHSIYT